MPKCEKRSPSTVVSDLSRGGQSKRYPKEYIEAVCDAIRASKAAVVAVSNEVGSGVVPAYTSGRIYRDFLGQMNQKIAQIADTVILMVAGVPVILKDSGISQHEGDASFAGSATNRSGESTNGVRKRHSSDGLNS